MHECQCIGIFMCPFLSSFLRFQRRFLHQEKKTPFSFRVCGDIVSFRYRISRRRRRSSPLLAQPRPRLARHRRRHRRPPVKISHTRICRARKSGLTVVLLRARIFLRPFWRGRSRSRSRGRGRGGRWTGEMALGLLRPASRRAAAHEERVLRPTALLIASISLFLAGISTRAPKKEIRFPVPKVDEDEITPKKRGFLIASTVGDRKQIPFSLLILSRRGPRLGSAPLGRGSLHSPRPSVINRRQKGLLVRAEVGLTCARLSAQTERETFRERRGRLIQLWYLIKPGFSAREASFDAIQFT